MRKIEKKREPRSWTEYRLTPGATYQRTDDLADSLLMEQGYICAYCMRRIPVKDTNSNETSRIEHILSRENHPELQLDYTNMVICCPGAISDSYHCDKLKGNRDISFPLFSDQGVNTIKYKSNGEISSDNPDWDQEIKKVLNLNNERLKENRKSTLKGVLNELNKREWKVSEIKKTIDQWRSKDTNGMYRPYHGIIVWYLTKKMNQAIRQK